MNLNVLHINKFHYLRGGADAVYFNTAKILEDHGHRSLFFSMHHPYNLPCETSNYFTSCVDLDATTNSIINQIKASVRILYSFEAKRRLSDLLNKYKVDIAHLHNITRYLSPSVIHVLKERKIPVVMTLHGYDLLCATHRMVVDGRPCEACKERKFFNIIRKKCIDGSFKKSALAILEMYLHHTILDIYNKIDVFISPSIFLKNKFSAMGFKKEIIYLPNFVDIKKFEHFKAGGAEENTIVYFGMLLPEKGLWTLLKVAKRLNTNTSSAVKINIIGDGPLRKQLEERVKSDEINNIRFLGYMKGESLFKEIEKSMAVVLPSEWYENNPLSVIEAFALGKPAIGARIGGIPELIKDGETGFTFESGNVNDMEDKILHLLRNPDESKRMGKMAKRFVENELSPDKYYEKLIDIYKSIL